MFPKLPLSLALLLGLAPGLQAGASSNIRLDQVGYLTWTPKVAVLARPMAGQGSPSTFNPGASFEVRRVGDDSVAFTGAPAVFGGGATHAQSGDAGWWADFSGLITPGDYYLYLPGGSNPGAVSHPFSLGASIYNVALAASNKSFYYQRCGTAITATHGGAWTHAACHISTQNNALLYNGGVVAGTQRDVTGGWHDAGDYRKYVSFATDPLWDLMTMAEWYPCAFGDDTNIPESGNGVPDILDEVKWELDWLLKMQIASGGQAGALYSGVFVTGGGSGGTGDPSTETTTYYYANYSSSATAVGAFAFAKAARLFQAYGAAYPGYSATLQAASEAAWAWLQANPANVTYNHAGFQNADANRSAALDAQLRLSAAAELFHLTGNATYRTYFDSNYNSAALTENGHHPILSNYFETGGSQTGQRAMVSYALAPGATGAVVTAIRTSARNGANNYPVNNYLNDLYRSFMWDGHYTWGSNQIKAQWGLNALYAIKIGANPATNATWWNVASEYLHYFFGRNPLGWSYTTQSQLHGAEQPVTQIYHGWFHDGTPWDSNPAPGILAGGPNQFFAPASGTVAPPQGEPIQKSYRDWNTSWPENSWEVTENGIYYQAKYQFLLAAFSGCAGPAPTATPTPTYTTFAGTPTFTATASPTPSFSPTPTPVCQTLLNGAETLAENGTWSGTNATRAIVPAGSAPAGAVTQGSNALYVDITVAGAWNDQFARLAGFAPQDWSPYTQLSMDVHVANSLVAGATYTELLLRADCASCGPGIWYEPISADAPTLVAGAQTVTWTLDLGQGSIPPGSPISALALVYNNNATNPVGALYIDNVRLIGACAAPSPTASPTRTPSASPTRTLSASPTRTLSASPTRTLSASPTRTLSATASRTRTPTPTATPGSSRPLVGAIRWDAWVGAPNAVGAAVETSLSPLIYHCRVPFYGVELSPTQIEARCITQACMDQEIAYAKWAGLDYWSFIWYPASSGLDVARNLYLSSTFKDDVKFTLILEASQFANLPTADLIDFFEMTNYVKVLGNRPLFYLLGCGGLVKADIDAIRAAATGAGLGEPYIVLMRTDGVLANVTTLGLDALSMYATTWVGNGDPYATLAATDVGQWDYVRTSGYKMVPNVTTGWDKRPRHDNPVFWEGDPGPNAWVQAPTLPELVGHVQTALDWVGSYPATADANTVILYAWNEFDEGGWISPTLASCEGTARVDALHCHFFGCPSPTPSPTRSPTQSASPSPTPSPSSSATRSVTLTVTPSASQTSQLSPTPTSTVTLSASMTETPSISPTETEYAGTPTVTPSPSETPTVSPSPTPVCSGGGYLGSSSVTGNFDFSGYIDGNLYSLPVSGTVTSIQFYVASGSGQVRVAVYADTAGVPGALLTQGGPGSFGPGVQSLDVLPYDLASGSYWLFVQTTPGLALGMTNSGGYEYYQAQVFADFPATLSGGSYANWTLGLLAVVCPLPTPTPSPSVSTTPTSTLSATLTASPTLTFTATHSSSTTPSPTSTHSTSTTPSPTNTLGVNSPTASPSVTPSFTSTHSASTTPSPTSTHSTTMTPSPTTTLGVNSPTVTPSVTLTPLASSGALVIDQAVAWPNPSPRAIQLQLQGPSDSIEVRVYTAAWVLAARIEGGPRQAGWSKLVLPNDWHADLASGVYYIQVTARRGAILSQPVTIKAYLLR